MKFSLYALIVLTQTAKVVFSFAADAGDYGGISKDADYNFTSIAGNYGSVESVDINLSCPTNQNIQLPSLMFTIIPGELASVSSFPSNVVYTAVKDGVLSFHRIQSRRCWQVNRRGKNYSPRRQPQKGNHRWI